MRILLVEDDEPTQELIAAMIKTVFTNIHIETADNGTYAYTRFLERADLDLLITDNVHLGMSGLELIERILARNPLQPIILQTGNSGAHIDSFMKRHGDIPCLRKPFDLHQFQEAVQAAFDRCSSRSTVSRKE